MVFCHFKKSWWQIGKKIMDTATKTGIDAANTASKQVA